METIWNTEMPPQRGEVIGLLGKLANSEALSSAGLHWALEARRRKTRLPGLWRWEWGCTQQGTSFLGGSTCSVLVRFHHHLCLPPAPTPEKKGPPKTTPLPPNCSSPNFCLSLHLLMLAFGRSVTTNEVWECLLDCNWWALDNWGPCSGRGCVSDGLHWRARLFFPCSCQAAWNEAEWFCTWIIGRH